MWGYLCDECGHCWESFQDSPSHEWCGACGTESEPEQREIPDIGGIIESRVRMWLGAYPGFVKDENMSARIEAEKRINEEGRGTCEFCKEEIFKNPAASGGYWTWESEAMIGFCDTGPDFKHRPLIKWTEDGIVNV